MSQNRRFYVSAQQFPVRPRIGASYYCCCGGAPPRTTAAELWPAETAADYVVQMQIQNTNTNTNENSNTNTNTKTHRTVAGTKISRLCGINSIKHQAVCSIQHKASWCIFSSMGWGAMQNVQNAQSVQSIHSFQPYILKARIAGFVIPQKNFTFRKGLQKCHKMAQKWPKMAQSGPNMTPNGPKWP